MNVLLCNETDSTAVLIYEIDSIAVLIYDLKFKCVCEFLYEDKMENFLLESF